MANKFITTCLENMTRLGLIAGLVVTGVGLVASTGLVQAGAVAPQDVKIIEGEVKIPLTGKPGIAANGRALYFNRKFGNCLACHANKDLADQPFHGEVGPALDGVASRYSEAQLRAIVINSKSVLGEGTIMPSFYRAFTDQRTRKKFIGKTILSAQQVEDVVAYLQTLK